MIPVPTRRLALVAAVLSLLVLALPGSGLRQVLWVDLALLVVALVFTTVKESAKELVLSLVPPESRARTIAQVRAESPAPATGCPIRDAAVVVFGPYVILAATGGDLGHLPGDR